MHKFRICEIEIFDRFNGDNLEDGLKSNLFKLKDLENIPILKSIILEHKKKLKIYSIDLIIRQIIREIINEMVNDVIKTTMINIRINKIQKLDDIYRAKNKLVSFSKKMQIRRNTIFLSLVFKPISHMHD